MGPKDEKKYRAYLDLAWRDLVPGLERFRDDGVQEILTKMLSRAPARFTHQKAKWMVIDHLRKHFVGRAVKTEGLREKKYNFVFAKTLEPGTEIIIGHESQLQIDDLLHLSEVLPYLKKDGLRPIFLLYYKWGFNITEIGELYERSDTWAYLKLKAAHALLIGKLKNKV